MNLFIKLCLNTGIVQYFTVGEALQQNGVKDCMNHILLKKLRYILSNTRLDKEFWAEACHIYTISLTGCQQL